MIKTIAHCIESSPNRPMPFVTDQVVDLEKHRSLVFSFNKGIWRDGWKDTPRYLPYASNQLKIRYYLNKCTCRVFKIPWDFHQAIKKNNVVLLHAHFIPTAIQFLPLKRKYKLPMVVSGYGYDVSRFPKESEENMNSIKELFKDVDLFIAMSEDMKRDFLMLGCPPDKVIIHHTGVDLQRFRYRGAKSNIESVSFLCVCDYSPKKGTPILMEAMAKVHENYPEAKLRIIGTPKWRGKPIKKQVGKMIHDLGLANAVKLIGAVGYHDVPKEYEQADIFVLPSQTDREGNKEGIPAVIMEAMATGLPVVSTRHAGIPELVVDGETGYLVPEGNPNELAEKMSTIMENKNKWKMMGLTGRKLIEREFNVEVQKLKLEKIYEKILDGKQYLKI